MIDLAARMHLVFNLGPDIGGNGSTATTPPGEVEAVITKQDAVLPWRSVAPALRWPTGAPCLTKDTIEMRSVSQFLDESA
jgi:hypothetical protein